jgi:hypothetical protein
MDLTWDVYLQGKQNLKLVCWVFREKLLELVLRASNKCFRMEVFDLRRAYKAYVTRKHKVLENGASLLRRGDLRHAAVATAQ